MTNDPTAGGGDQRPRRRQARGERRMAEILDAAAGVFASAGYEAATTNAIAAAAGISPGSLYQFYPNKQAIAQALADRFVAQLRATRQAAFDGVDFTRLRLAEVLDRVVDPIVAFNIANPGFKALFARPDMPADLTEATQPIQHALHAAVEELIAARAPDLPAAQRRRTTQVSMRIVQAITPLAVAATGAERAATVVELKKVLFGYLEPVIGDAPTAPASRAPARARTRPTSDE
ncbi:TetR/AcrR family transcriptional regulator [Goodfellowiella coeruleoviolacea]|uniref:Transcriptional regulator, TetR family n=1 Tax=Goodfellowiella coeruleoviolacea TaxID=334858 RepID=A0AAE3G8Z3_9PSEU|nr:TetR family transcriptional regulator [Goodfellowiella coeruleoviolacea]MCP2163765.1 transcriptional regulator, TetR family [Goodfellowiella coeruleoviolacea]